MDSERPAKRQLQFFKCCMGVRAKVMSWANLMAVKIERSGQTVDTKETAE